MFFSDWRQVNDPELVQANWLSDQGLRDVVIPSLRKSSNTSQHDAAHIFETLFLGGVGANTLMTLNKNFSVQNTEWKRSEFFSFFKDFMEKDCPLKHFLRHLTLVAERFAEGVVMGPFQSLDAVAAALKLKVHNLSRTPNLAAWEGEFFRICRQYNRIPSTCLGSNFSYNDFIADFDSPISVTMIKDLAALVCGWDALTTLDGRDAFNGIMSAREWWQHQVDPVYNPADGKMWYFIQCSAGFGRKDLAAAYHFYSLYAMSHIATEKILQIAPEVIPQFARPKIDLIHDTVIIGNPKQRYVPDEQALKDIPLNEQNIVKDYTPPLGRKLPGIQFWECISGAQCFIHTSDANYKDFRRGIWHPLSLALTKRDTWRDYIARGTSLFFDSGNGVRIFYDANISSPTNRLYFLPPGRQKALHDRGGNCFHKYYACQTVGKNTFWFDLNPIKSHQYEQASNANALEAYIRSTSNTFIPYVVSYDDWAIPAILEPDSSSTISRQSRLLRISALVCKSAEMAKITGVVVRPLGLRMADEKTIHTWFSKEILQFLKKIDCPIAIDTPPKGTPVAQILRTCGDLNLWILRQDAEIFEGMHFPLKGHSTTLLGKKLDFTNQTITLDSKKKKEHMERFQKVLNSGWITIAEFLKITGVLIHWAEGSKIRRNLVSPLFKIIIKSISPLAMDFEVRKLIADKKFRSVIELIQKKWRGLLKRHPPTSLSFTERCKLEELIPMFLDPLPAKPILFRNCDAHFMNSFCSDATKKTFGGHTMSLLARGNKHVSSPHFLKFWWALDFSSVTSSLESRSGDPHSRFWLECRTKRPMIYSFIRKLKKEPVHIIEFVAVLVTLLIYKNRIFSRGDMSFWSPYIPLKFYCDNQPAVTWIHRGFALEILDKPKLVNLFCNAEILSNILFQDILTIPGDSPAGQFFMKNELPFVQQKISLVEVPILPVYVHTTLCTADHLTRGKSLMLNQTPVKIDSEKCIEHFDPDFRIFQEYQASNEEIFAALQFIQERRIAWIGKLWEVEMTEWEHKGKHRFRRPVTLSDRSGRPVMKRKINT